LNHKTPIREKRSKIFANNLSDSPDSPMLLA
jgi:hypothetical protein